MGMLNNVFAKVMPLLQLPLFGNEPQPDSFHVRVSARARRLSVRVYPAGRVEVVVPPRTPARIVQQFVAKHRQWIEERIEECQVQHAALVAPTELHLPALQRHVQVHLKPEQGALKLRQLGDAQILLRGSVHEPTQWCNALYAWLTNVAYTEFQQQLSALATRYDFAFERLQIRRQRTRWGSCSSSGTISLNVCGLFVEPEVLRYLMIHELCHTRHMNHSERFWRLVERCEPNYRELDKQLNVAWRQVPVWMFHVK